MLSSDYLFTLTDNISNVYEELNDTIIQDIARRIAKMDYLTSTAQWQLQRAKECGAIYEETINKISQYTGKSDAEIMEMFKNAGIDNWNNNLLRAGMKPDNLFNLSENAKNVLVAGLNKTNGLLKNMTMTTANMAQQDFITTADLIYQQISSGAFDYNTAIRSGIKNLASKGITTIEYGSGIKRSMDSTVRTVALTGINQTTGKMTEIQRQEVGANGYETTAHSGARPEHAIWQGKQFYVGTPVKGYDEFVSATGYGSVTGLKGANCRHDFFWVFLGEDAPSYTQKELKKINDKTVNYHGKQMSISEAEQQMRYIERNTRSWKRQSNATKAAGLDNSVEQAKVKAWTNRYKDFSKETGIKKQNARLVVYDERKQMTKLDNSDIIQPNYIRKNVSSGYNTTKEENAIRNSIEIMPQKLKEKLKNEEFEIITHNITDKNCSRYDRNNNKFYIYENAPEYEVIHEIGHYVETKYNVLNDEKYIKIRANGLINNSIYSIKDLPNYDNAKGINNNKFISEQQGRIYKFDLNGNSYIANNQKINLNCLGEYFSEGFREYWVNPDNLKKQDLDLFKYIKEVLLNVK